MHKTMKNKLVVPFGALVLATAGCGGGGGGGSSSNNTSDEPVAITAENGATVGRTTGTGATGVGQSGSSFTQGQIVSGTELDGGNNGISAVEGTRLMLEQVREYAGDSADAATGVVTSTDCPGDGSIEVDESGLVNDELDVDDTFSATWDQCEAGSSVIDGSVEFEVTACDSCNNTAPTNEWGYAVELTYTDWSIVFGGSINVDFLFDGSLALTAENTPGEQFNQVFELTGGPLSFVDRLEDTSFTYNSLDIRHEVDSDTNNYKTFVNDMDFTSSEVGGSVTASTQAGEPLTGDGSTEYPTGGILVINGAEGSQAIVYAGDSECAADEFGLDVNGTKSCEPWVE